MRTILLLGLTVVASIAAAVVGLWVVRLVVPLAVLQANNDVAGDYLQTLGTIYAVLLAFVVFVVWTQQNDAWKLVERQANELADVLRIVQVFGEPVKSQVFDAARGYVHEVAEREWPAMAHGRSSPRAAQLLHSLWQALVAFEPKTTREEVLYTEAVARFNDLCDVRTDLLLNSRTRLPPTLCVLLVTGGFSTVASMYLFGMESFWSLALMTGSMAGAVSFVLFLIRDLDSPFSGDWQVTAEPILLALGPIAVAG